MNCVRFSQSSKRPGFILVLTAVAGILMLGCIVLAVDVGQLYVTRAELQRAADAAALAGASGYFTDPGLIQDVPKLTKVIHDRAEQFSLCNETLRSETAIDPDDMILGTSDLDEPRADMDTSGSRRLNAVQITVRRTPGSVNGGVPFYFAGILGLPEGGVTAKATAAVDDRFAGYRILEKNGPLLLPFTKQVDDYEALVLTGSDRFSYDDGVQPVGDGVREVNIYPTKGKGGDEEASGNFGILNFRGHNATAMADVIRTGVTAEDLISSIGESELHYTDDAGEPVTHDISGTPGLKVTLQDPLRAHLGKIVGFFVHSQSFGNGSHVVYRNVGIRFGRVMEVELTGNEKRLVIQPAAVTSETVIVDERAPSSDGRAGRVILIK